MKKLLVCVLVAVLLPASLFAIDLSAGVKGGLSLGMFGGSDWKDILDAAGMDNGMKLGASATAFLNIAVTESITIQPEAGFTMLGGKLAFDAFDLVSKMTLNTIEFPVFIMPKFSLGPGSLAIFVGPDFFYVLGDMKTAEYADGEKVDEFEDPIENSLLIGFAGGIGYLYPLGGGNLVVDAKYSRVLTEMEDDAKVFPGAINVRVGYSVQL